MVGRLVSKLPRSYQEEWDRHVTTPSIALLEQTDWEKFTKWLERQKEVAVSARLRAVANQQAQKTPTDSATAAKGGSSGNTTNRAKEKFQFWGEDGCWKCGGNGHIGRNCTAPQTQQIRSNAIDVEQEFTGAVGGGQSFTRPETKEGWLALFPEIKQKVGV